MACGVAQHAAGLRLATRQSVGRPEAAAALRRRSAGGKQQPGSCKQQGAVLRLGGGSSSRRAAVAMTTAAAPPARAIEEEEAVASAPESLVKEETDGRSTGMRVKFERMVRAAQDEICAALEELEGGAATFREDAWTRPGGGGGISRVLQGGKVFEKAGVNVSVVYGSMPPEAYRAATGQSASAAGATQRVPFFAAGISSVVHPHNPFAPTMHFNYRYFETDAPEDLGEAAPRAWWFGGGTDLTPSYLYEEDAKHFHGTYKEVCDKHDPAFYPRFKKWCDDYFMIVHRGERRGIGGIFFDDMNDRDAEALLAFSTDCAAAVVPAYAPLVAKRKDTPYETKHKDWQGIRRGRYVEFNLVYDRGTTFGLKTGGRIESILMSLPQVARWEYDHHPEEGSEEAVLLDACKNPKDWLGIEADSQ
eukprot:jgi/Chlat1/2892/Chrsp2S04658